MSVQTIVWTKHAEYKLRIYQVSRTRVSRVLRSPVRIETGVVEGTHAVMQPTSTRMRAGKRVWTSEIWVMYQKKGTRKVIITAWRYPGISPIRDHIPIPADILRELKKEGVLLDTNSLYELTTLSDPRVFL